MKSTGQMRRLLSEETYRPQNVAVARVGSEHRLVGAPREREIAWALGAHEARSTTMLPRHGSSRSFAQ